MSIDTDYATLREVLAAHKPEGWAAEFGVYTGYSLNLISQHMPVVGFDSFKGLPEDWRPGFGKGKFRDENVLKHVPTFNAMIVEGLFENTAHFFPFPPLALVHIDCDLYSSTATALRAVEPYIDAGTIIVFDEFHGYEGAEDHEAKAWDEFCARHRVAHSLLSWGMEESAFVIDHMEHS